MSVKSVVIMVPTTNTINYSINDCESEVTMNESQVTRNRQGKKKNTFSWSSQELYGC